jgi:uracil-DNA glycosylase
MNPSLQAVLDHQAELRACRLCPKMTGPVITCTPNLSRILMVGQAPGEREGQFGRPFAWTAGKTLFGWYGQIGADEAMFRERVYIAAVCRCFPGKNPKGGDRVPDREEITHCSKWLNAEIKMLQPQLMIPVGKLAIEQFLPVKLLKDVIGKQHVIELEGRSLDVIPLPHPSGVSTWHRVEPGKTLLQDALRLIERHSAWREMLATPSDQQT